MSEAHAHQNEGPTIRDAVDSVLVPLSKSTGKTLEPLRLQDSDWMFVDLDSDGVRFVIELKALKRQGEGNPQTRHVIDGVEYQEHFWGPSYMAESFFNRFPEHHRAPKSQKHVVGGTDFSALLIHHCWPQHRIVWRCDEARMLYEFLLRRFFAQNARALAIAEFKENRTVPTWSTDRGEDFREIADLQLNDYQRTAVELALGQDALGLFMDRGTGKTPIVVQRVSMEGLRARAGRYGGESKMFRALIVCPPQVRTNWANEFARFATAPGKVTIIRGGQIRRIRTLTHGITSEDDCAFAACVVSYDSLVASRDAFLRIAWDLVVLDESHFIKSASTNRWAVGSMLRECARFKMILTGTPIGNSPMDLWTQLEFLGAGLSGFMSFKHFRSFHGVWSKSVAGVGVDRLIGLKNVPLLQERLARLTFAVSKEDARLGLPDKVYDVHEVTMTKHQRDVYRTVATQLAAEVEDRLTGDVGQMTIEHILTSLLRLAQITSGFATWDEVRDDVTDEVIKPKRVVQIAVPNPKVEAVVEMLKEDDRDPRGKTLIWCTWVEDIRVLSERLTREGIVHGTYYGATPAAKREENVHRFNNDPEFKVMIANAQTAGEGLNLVGYDYTDPDRLDTYCDHVIFFSQNWSAILRGQAEDRAHRRGTRMPVRITDLTVPGTIDDEIRERVRMKQRMADMVTDVRSILKSVLNVVNNGDEE